MELIRTTYLTNSSEMITHAVNLTLAGCPWNDMKKKAKPKAKFSAVMMCQT